MNWELVVLGEHTKKIGSGSTPKGGNSVYVDSGTAFIRSKNVRNLSFDRNDLAHISDKNADHLKGVEVKENDVLLNITGDSVARCCLVPNDVLPARVSQHVSIIRPDTSIDSKYLAYYLVSPSMQNLMLGLAEGSGATRNALTKEDISKFKIPLPPLSTQRRIADILSAYDDLIENNQRQIKLLEESAMRLYREWFVFMRFPGHESVRIVDGVPEGWRDLQANELFDITIGKTPSRAEPKWFSTDIGDVKWISIGDMRDANVFIYNTSECLTESAVEKFNLNLIPANTVVLSFKLTVGAVAITTENMFTNEAIAHFRINDDKMLEYTYEYLKNFPYNSLGNTSSISTAINSKIVKEIPFILPSNEVLEDFHKQISPIFSEIRTKSMSIQLLQKARDALLPRLMNGGVGLKLEGGAV